MAFIYLTEQGSVLKKTGQRLVVEKDEQVLLDIPAEKIEGVLIFGNVQFTTQALHLLFQHGIELAIFSSRGKLLGQLTATATKNIALRQAQYARHGDKGFVLSLAHAIVSAKMANGLELVRGFAHNHPDTDLGEEMEALSRCRAGVEEHADLEGLLGVEGNAARIYFGAFAKMVRHSFRFDGRHRHPSPDPVNALLSLGYTMVYNEISSLLDGLGFDPYLGFYHQPHFGHATLASDLVEEFRSPLTDRFTLTLINNRVFGEDDFYVHAPSGAVYLKDEPRKRYFLEYERFVSHPSTEPNEAAAASFRHLFRRQAERLREAVMSGGSYSPYTFSW